MTSIDLHNNLTVLIDYKQCEQKNNKTTTNFLPFYYYLSIAWQLLSAKLERRRRRKEQRDIERGKNFEYRWEFIYLIAKIQYIYVCI